MAIRMVHAQSVPGLPPVPPTVGYVPMTVPEAAPPTSGARSTVPPMTWDEMGASVAGLPSFAHPAVQEALAEIRTELNTHPHFGLDNSDLIRRATAHAIRAHDGANRKSGEPYAIHPLRVGAILGLDADGPGNGRRRTAP